MLIPMALATAAITFFLVGSIVKAHRSRVQTGNQALVHTEAVAHESFVLDGEHYACRHGSHAGRWRRR